jgi:hypothetical protein
MNSEQVANILAFYSYYNPKDDVDAIAAEFKVPASLIVNGLFYGEGKGLFTSDRQRAYWKNITVVNCPGITDDFGKDVERIKGIMMETITNLNGVQEDILEENLFIWVGAPLTVSKVALQLLINEGKLTKYWIRDLKDPKSKYYYPTLPENVEKKFAQVNFKHQSGKKGGKNESLPRRKR